MAMIKCKECGADISSEAMKCPNCGIMLRKPKRGVFGQIFKYLFIFFNILMIIFLFLSGENSGNALATATSDAERAGVAVGTTIWAGTLLILWVIGDIILGLFVLFTRPKY